MRGKSVHQYLLNMMVREGEGWLERDREGEKNGKSSLEIYMVVLFKIPVFLGRRQAWQNQLNVVKIRLEHYARRHDKVTLISPLEMRNVMNEMRVWHTVCHNASS